MTNQAESGKGVSLTKFEGGQVLDEGSKKDVSAIHKMSIDDFTLKYLAPSNNDEYFYLRTPPLVWESCMKKFSEAHVFYHAVQLASADRNLSDYLSCKSDSELGCSEGEGDEAGLMWLSGRPVFSLIKMIPNRGEHTGYNAWSKRALNGMRGIAKRSGKTAKLVFIIYSTKSMLTSKSVNLGAWRLILERDVVLSWDNWLSEELVKIRRFLASRSH